MICNVYLQSGSNQQHVIRMVVNVGIVGTGIFARDSHMAALKVAGGYNVVACTNRTREKAERFAAEFGVPKVYDTLEELLNDPNVEAVDVLLPVCDNWAAISKVIAAGKPVCFEKPIAADLGDARKIVNLSNSTNLPVMILENWCYQNRTKELKRRLNEIGEVVTFVYQRTNGFIVSKYASTKWRQFPKHVGGPIADACVHDMGLLTEVLGPVKTLSARARQLQPASNAIDVVSAQFNMESGVFGNFICSRDLASCKPTFKLEIFGTKGSILLSAAFGEIPSLSIYRGLGIKDTSSTYVEIEPEQVNGLVPEFANFRNAVAENNKKLILSTPAKGFHHFAIINAIVDSANKDGERVDVETEHP